MSKYVGKRFACQFIEDEHRIVHELVIGKALKESTCGVLLGVEYPKYFHGHNDLCRFTYTNWRGRCYWVAKNSLRSVDEGVLKYYDIH